MNFSFTITGSHDSRSVLAYYLVAHSTVLVKFRIFRDKNGPAWVCVRNSQRGIGSPALSLPAILDIANSIEFFCLMALSTQNNVFRL